MNLISKIELEANCSSSYHDIFDVCYLIKAFPTNWNTAF